MRLILVALTCFLSEIVALGPNPCAVLPPPGTGFVNDPRSCPAYFSCLSFLSFEVTCPPPFYFNAREQTCDYPSNANCNNCPPTGVHSLPNPTSCTRWTLCVNGNALPQECAPGTAFDESIGTCNIAESVVCAANTCAQIQGGIGVAPSPESCERFFYCYNGLKVGSASCAPQLLFDSVSKRCVRSGAVCFPGTERRLRRAFSIIPEAPVRA